MPLVTRLPLDDPVDAYQLAVQAGSPDIYCSGELLIGMDEFFSKALSVNLTEKENAYKRLVSAYSRITFRNSLVLPKQLTYFTLPFQMLDEFIKAIERGDES